MEGLWRLQVTAHRCPCLAAFRFLPLPVNDELRVVIPRQFYPSRSLGEGGSGGQRATLCHIFRSWVLGVKDLELRCIKMVDGQLEM